MDYREVLGPDINQLLAASQARDAERHAYRQLQQEVFGSATQIAARLGARQVAHDFLSGWAIGATQMPESHIPPGDSAVEWTFPLNTRFLDDDGRLKFHFKGHVDTIRNQFPLAQIKQELGGLVLKYRTVLLP